MSFTSQFALSLELTKLIPMGLAVAGKTYEAAMSLARDLQRSGSDIVVEEGLAQLFGRLRITSQMASTFRTVVSKSSPPQTLCGDIVLCDGPGPTVIRAFTQEAYFSLVLQCSFLLSIHEKRSLAAAIAYNFDKLAQGAPEGRAVGPTPGQDGIFGFLQACEDQTSSFNWEHILLAVGATLGSSEEETLAAIPSVIFRGLLTMLPLVQHFPEERLIHIETNHGACAIITWVHHLLGLPVLVRLHHDQGFVEQYPFGSSEVIIINIGSNLKPTILPSGESEFRNGPPTITLLESSDNETLFRMVGEPDEDIIDATFMTPACGYGTKILNAAISLEDGRDQITTEMTHIATASAVCISKMLVINGVGLGSPLPYKVPKYRIYEAASLLFDGINISQKKVDQYIVDYPDEALFRLPKPKDISEWIQHSLDGGNCASPEDIFSNVKCSKLCCIAIQLSILILAFANVSDIHACSDLPLTRFPNLLCSNYLWRQIDKGGRSNLIYVESDVWLEIIIQLTIGHKSELSFGTENSLISARGWSIFLNTFGNADPSYLDPGCLAIKKGVPCRNGVWKHRVIDGPRRSCDYFMWKVEASPGESIALSCAGTAAWPNPLVGELGDSFVVSIRVKTANSCNSDGSTTPIIIRRTGYNELAEALWRTQKSNPCQHQPRLGEKVVLEPGIMAFSGFGDDDNRETIVRLMEERDIAILLTAGNTTARWRALISIQGQRRRDCSYPPVMIRGRDCCFACVIEQTCIIRQNWQQPLPGDIWYIVL